MCGCVSVSGVGLSACVSLWVCVWGALEPPALTGSMAAVRSVDPPARCPHLAHPQM